MGGPVEPRACHHERRGRLAGGSSTVDDCAYCPLSDRRSLRLMCGAVAQQTLASGLRYSVICVVTPEAIDHTEGLVGFCNGLSGCESVVATS